MRSRDFGIREVQGSGFRAHPTEFPLDPTNLGVLGSRIQVRARPGTGRGKSIVPSLFVVAPVRRCATNFEGGEVYRIIPMPEQILKPLIKTHRTPF